VSPRPLYAPAHVAIATLLGGPFAGGLLVSLTLDRLGRRTTAVTVALVSLALALAAVTVGEALEAPYGTLPLVWALLIGGATWVALGSAVRQAEEDGTQVGSLYGLGVSVLLGIAVMMAWAAAT